MALHAQPFERALDAYQRGDYPTALAGFRVLAQQGHPVAQYNLGVMYDNGLGVPKSEREALNWYLKAAEQGHADAQFNLGIMYANGRGVPKSEREALNWYLKSAVQGDADAQFNLGIMYANGQGVPKNEREAVNWYLKAAKQGHARAQFNLGVRYANGQGVPKDYQQAYFWWLLASASGHQGATKNRDLVERDLTAAQRAAAQAAARNWSPTTGQTAPPPTTAGTMTAPADSTGSGFRVARGAIVTNHHVVDRCSRLHVNGVAAQVHGSDARSDLALLNVNLAGPSIQLRAQRAAIGEPVAVAGFPLRGLLSGFNMTTGTLSSLSGMGGDTRLVQITAPVQPGNSGGPLLDSAGNLMGVVVSKLDAIKTAQITGDIPQNVNFAINTNVLRSFLDAYNVDYETAGAERAMTTTGIADKAKGVTVLVECWK